MNDTAALLKECNAGCKSATNNMEQMRAYITNQRLKSLVSDYNDRHIALGDKCHALLDKIGETEKDPSPIPAAMAKMSNTIRLTFSDDTAHIAGLLCDGCNMGIKSLAKYKNKYTEASEDAKRITQDLIDLEVHMTQDLLAFL
ncbi:MAG: hypothetical protein J6R42_03575 [Clostridia bacterium]|nr:hypothetical protein [Clostridia bacterium]